MEPDVRDRLLRAWRGEIEAGAVYELIASANAIIFVIPFFWLLGTTAHFVVRAAKSPVDAPELVGFRTQVRPWPA